MSNIRYDRLHDTHVIIAPERLHRPHCFSSPEKIKVSDENCPFCEGHESMTPPEIFAIRAPGSFVNEAGWQTRVVPNLYKAVQIEAPHKHHYGLFEYWEGFGAHEIIIDTPQHYTSMTQWRVNDVVSWLKTLRARVEDLRRDHRIASITLFKNEGEEAGATQPHSHTQLIALPFISKVERTLYQRSFEHYKQSGNALLETIVRHEEEDGARIVGIEGDFTAYCPYASAYPFEVMIASKKALGQIDTLSNSTIESVAPLLLETLKKLKVHLGCFPFNLTLMMPPLQANSIGEAQHAHVDDICRFGIRIMPRLYTHGGFELSTDMMINPILPEQAAKLLREGLNA
ncbi:MAG: UTP--glucose-1-phosphate uridylyltransferase [Campylobacterota bacterium]|nr:UTP--glucose-1-phosphate uridylyltransferase [Campylobacterota bacterium]